jgi:aminopeptidase
MESTARSRRSWSGSCSDGALSPLERSRCNPIRFAPTERPRYNILQERLAMESLAAMHDPRYDKLAKVLVEYSTRLKRNRKKMDANIAVRRSHNITELSDVPPEQMKLVAKKMRPVVDWRVKKTKWVVLRWPSPSMAQLASMSTEAFEDFYFDVCTLDYRKLQPGMKALKALMDRTDRVEIKGPGTDLRFSIKGIGAVICGGDRNIPDGEVFSCPIKDSVEGHVLFNAPTIYQGTGFDNIRLEFENGKVVKATANNTQKLNKILDSDPGARYIGEFSLGFNPFVLHPMRDILFDEKIAGSFHFTPGQAYEDADNGNRSQVHWDMVCIQRPDYGGGEVYFDGKLIRRDGEFLPANLRSLNRGRFVKK